MFVEDNILRCVIFVIEFKYARLSENNIVYYSPHIIKYESVLDRFNLKKEP